MVQICLGGLSSRYGPIGMAICTREKPPSFSDLQSMLMVEGNHASGRGPLNQTIRCCTRRQNGPMGVEDEVDRHTIVAAKKSMKEGTEGVKTIVWDLPRGVKVVPETSKQKPIQNVRTIARRATRRGSVGRSVAESDKSRSGSGKTEHGNQQCSYYAVVKKTVRGWN